MIEWTDVDTGETFQLSDAHALTTVEERRAAAANEKRLDVLGAQAAKAALNPSSVPALVAALNAISAGSAMTAPQKTAFLDWVQSVTEYVARDRFHENATAKAAE